MAEKASRQLFRFIDYLESHPQPHRIKEDAAEYEVWLSNLPTFQLLNLQT